MAAIPYFTGASIGRIRRSGIYVPLQNRDTVNEYDFIPLAINACIKVDCMPEKIINVNRSNLLRNVDGSVRSKDLNRIFIQY